MKVRILTGMAATLALAFTASTASAAVIGHLDVANCSGNGVTVTATTIDWEPIGGGTGCIATGTQTNVTYTGGGPLVSGVQGAIKDLPPAPVTDFMTFVGNPNLHFDLGGFGPAPANTNCAGLALFQACSVFAGSPFVLTLTPTGTSVTLSVFGNARDTSNVITPWMGAYTTQIAGQTPGQIQAIINTPGGSVRSTYSGDFTLTTVPEPASMLLLGTGLLGASLFRRRGVKK